MEEHINILGGNYRVNINTQEENEQVQKALFKLGCYSAYYDYNDPSSVYIPFEAEKYLNIQDGWLMSDEDIPDFSMITPEYVFNLTKKHKPVRLNKYSENTLADLIVHDRYENNSLEALIDNEWVDFTDNINLFLAQKATEFRITDQKIELNGRYTKHDLLCIASDMNGEASI